MGDRYDVVAAGHICFDIIPRFPISGVPEMSELFKPGKLINMAEIKVSSGGPVSNTGLGLHILGVSVGFMGKVGNDFFGQGLLQLLEKYQAHESMTVVEGEHTSYTIVMVPGDVDRIFLHHPGANMTYTSADVNYDVVKKAKLFHLGYPPLMRGLYENDGAELIATFRKAKEAGATTSLDMALPDPSSESGQVDWRKVLEGLLPYVDIFLPSGEEAMFMMQREKYDELNKQARGSETLDLMTPEMLGDVAEEILSFGSKVVVIKLAHRGMYLRSRGAEVLAKMGRATVGDAANWAERELWEEAFYVEKVASATGSGDSSIAGFLGGFLRGLSVEECLKTGCCVGGQNVQVMDAVSGIHSWKETLAMMPSWQKRRQKLESPGWRYDDEQRLWIGGKDRKGA